MQKLLKKIVSLVTTFMTIASTVSMGALSFAPTASAAMAGDLVKASTPAVYYYAADGKRYVFPNEKTYFSWYKDFSSVKTISDAELAAMQIGGNVAIRPGTKLVKITTDPKVYAVTKSGSVTSLHWVQTEAIATSLYGANWAQRVVDVPDAFFTNYVIGAPLATASHPNGSLVSYAGDSARYVIWEGQKRMITDAGFSANGFNSADVIPTTISYPAGSSVNGAEAALWNVGGSGSGSTPTPTGGNLQVALASDTPAGITIPKGGSSIQMAKFNFTAGAAAATITALTIHQVGVAAATDISNVYVYDANGTRLTSGRTINSVDRKVTFNSLNVSVAAGQTVGLVLQADYATSATAGAQFSLEVPDAASVVINGGTVGGSFPARGNTFTVGSATGARVDVQKGSTPANPNVGSKQVEISNFKLVGNTNDVEVRRITLLQAGTITNTDLANLNLYQGATLVASTASLVNDKIVLTFNPPYLLSSGATKVFSLKGDVSGRSSRTIKTYVEYTTDVYAIDKVFNAGANVCITSSGDCGTGSFDGSGSNYIELTTQGGQLTVAFNGPATSNIAKGTNGVELYKFSLTSQENDLEIKKIIMKVGATAAAGRTIGSSGTSYFRNLRIKNLDTGSTVMGPLSLSGSSGTVTSTLTFTDAFVLKSGATVNLALVSDLYSGTDDNSDFADQGYVASLNNGSSAIFGSTDVRIINTGEYLATSKIIPNSPITGNTLTVKASSLDVTLAASPSSNTVVKKQSNIPAVGFVFTAGAQSDVLVTSVQLTGSATTSVGAGGSYSAALLDDVVTACGLYDGETVVGLSQAPDSSGEMTISNMNFKIPKGTSKTLLAKCTADSVISDTTNGDKFAIGIAADADVTAQDGDANSITAAVSSAVENQGGTASASFSVTQTVKSSGTLSLATNNLRQATILVAGGDVWQNFAEFKATAQYEGMSIDRIAVTSTGAAASFAKIAVAQNGVVKGEATLPSGVFQTKDVDLSGSPITIPKDGSVTFQLWGKLADIQASSSVSGAAIDTGAAARSGNTIALGVLAGNTSGEWDSNYSGKYNVKAAGSASGERVYTTGSSSSGNSFVARKTKPVVTKQTVGSSLVSGVDVDLYKFQIAADPAGPIAVKKVVFNLSIATGTNSTLNLSSFRIRRGSSDLTTSAVRIMDTSGRDLGGSDSISGYMTTTSRITVEFNTEETISGSGNVYTLHATVGGSLVSGDSVTASFYRTTSTTPVTGYLTGSNVTSTWNNKIQGPNLDTGTTVDNLENSQGTFVWSDQSEVPHTSVSIGSAPTTTSRDWTDDLYLEDMTQQVSLTRS